MVYVFKATVGGAQLTAPSDRVQDTSARCTLQALTKSCSADQGGTFLLPSVMEFS